MLTEKMNIKSMFKTKQAILESTLNILLTHPPTKGEHNERAWINYFRSFLPDKFAIDKGFAFDAKGNVSDQIDVILYDALYTPLIFSTEADDKYITAESIYAVFESKPVINKETIEYANKKAATIVNLIRSSRGMINAGKAVPPRELTHIIGGILAIDSIENETSLREYLTYSPYIDIGCAIKKTSFFAYRSEAGGLLDIKFSSKEESILALFYFVLDGLYKIGTVAGIDIRNYSDATLDSIKLMRGNF